MFKAMQAIGAGVRKQRQGYGDDVAGLYFLHGKDGTPSKSISEDIAIACPEGAERFGYDYRPYHGYAFSFLQQMVSGGKLTPLNRRDKERELAWDGGTIKTRLVHPMPPVVAKPVDPTLPTFYLNWGSIYVKQLKEDETLEAAPETPWQEGWAEATFID
ncbi:MAG: hypothetical protein WBF93_06975 [Pirellulales bacterium]